MSDIRLPVPPADDYQRRLNQSLVQLLREHQSRLDLIAGGFLAGARNTATTTPTTGTYALGDFVRNSSPSVLGSGADAYVVLGWICTAAGTPGTWKEVSAMVALGVDGNWVITKTSGYGIQVDLDSPTFPWADIIGNVEPKATGTGSPARSVYAGGNLGQYSFVANDVCDFQFHIPHDYLPGSDIYFHVHWSHTGTSISGNAVFDIYHTYAKGHDQANFPAEKNVTITYNTTNIATTPQYRHRIDEVVISAGSATATLMDRDDIEPDGMLLATLKMTTLPTMGGGGKLFVHTCDIHYQSTGIGTKQKAPNFYV